MAGTADSASHNVRFPADNCQKGQVTLYTRLYWNIAVSSTCHPAVKSPLLPSTHTIWHMLSLTTPSSDPHHQQPPFPAHCNNSESHTPTVIQRVAPQFTDSVPGKASGQI